MEAFTEVQGVAAQMVEANVNTDDILPSVWVLNPDTNLGEKLFANRRYDQHNAEIPTFVLNRPPYRKSRILISGANFGCGSSREAAVWALIRYGIRCVIALSFGEIFRENCFQNGILPIALDPLKHADLLAVLAEDSAQTLKVDLRSCRIEFHNAPGIEFEVPSERRSMLLSGLDTLTQLLSFASVVKEFETSDQNMRPWMAPRRS